MAPVLERAARKFPAVVLTGPRRSGKTTLLRRLFPKASYHLLEDPDVLARVRQDPRTFVEEIKPPVIIDEIQHAPELFAYIRTRVDAAPRRFGRWLITGSQDAPLMQGVSESMAGRAAILHLLPLSLRESPRVSMLAGGYPESVLPARVTRVDRRTWFSSYVQTYLERDVRAITAVRDLATFRRFMSLLATRTGTMLNRSDLATPLGVSVPTISQWLSVLETTSIIALVPPYFESLGKRLTKSPKVYVLDSGLACHLLGIESDDELSRSPLRGALFEGFVASEIIKRQLNAGRRRELYWYRDHHGLDVDFVIPAAGIGSKGRSGAPTLIEAKASRTVRPGTADSLFQFGELLKRSGHGAARSFVVHSGGATATTALRPGVQAVSLTSLLDELG